MSFDLRMAVLSQSGALSAARQARELLACNDTTSTYGLRLTPQQAQALLNTRSAALRKTGRVELGGSILQKVVLTFCESPYLMQESYEETLHQLVDAFYYFKNECRDRLSDREVLDGMKRLFDGVAQGATEHLAGVPVEALTDLDRKGDW